MKLLFAALGTLSETCTVLDTLNNIKKKVMLPEVKQLELDFEGFV